MKSSSKILIILVCAAVIATLGVRVYLREVKKEATANEQNIENESVPVQVEQVKRGVIKKELVLTGSIAPAADVQVIPEVVGKILRYNKDKGEQVKKGELLVEIDPQDYVLRLEQSKAALSVAEAQLEEVKTNLANTEKDLRRMKKLYDEGAVSQQFYDDVKTRYDSLVAKEKLARASVEQAEVQLDEAKLKLADTKVFSPINGIVADRYIDVGDMATLSMPLYRIVDVDTVKVVVEVPEAIIPLLKQGEPVGIEVDAFPSEQFEGKIRIISPTVDHGTRTASVEITIANVDRRLNPGMFCRARFIIGEHKDVIVVRRDSLIREGNVYFAYVVKENKAERRKVSVGIIYRENAEILDGLQEGESLVVEGQARLNTGKTVRIVE